MSGEEDGKREDKGEMLTTGGTESERGLTLSMARLKQLALKLKSREAQGSLKFTDIYPLPRVVIIIYLYHTSSSPHCCMITSYGSGLNLLNTSCILCPIKY